MDFFFKLAIKTKLKMKYLFLSHFITFIFFSNMMLKCHKTSLTFCKDQTPRLRNCLTS